ncbi:MAG: porphobilinogen synthase, partial [Chloroflexi bacterium]|nr:porphobilinogen synthase [Chloroflexota bacterium]
MRRIRQVAAFRDMVRETELSARHFVYPLFIRAGVGVRDEIATMPGCHHFSPDTVAREAEEVARLGIPAVLLFGLPEEKDEAGSGAYAEDGVVQQAVRAIKRAAPGLSVITDVCLCEYTSHGHCGVIVNGQVDNDRSVDLVVATALSHVEAGADMVAPSDMMDGRIGAIREALDAEGATQIPVMAYSAKYASAFYGPFREAADSAPQFGDRSGYQMDPGNAREALRELEIDALEGADILMVKPALSYLDVIAKAR